VNGGELKAIIEDFDKRRHERVAKLRKLLKIIGFCPMKSQIHLVWLFTLTAGLLSGCNQNTGEPDGMVGNAEVTSHTSVGGIVRFSGVMAGIAVDAANKHCQMFDQNALPLSFYKIGPDRLGRDQVMTFEFKSKQ